MLTNGIETQAVLQDHTTAQVTVPGFEKLTVPQARAILHAVDLIRGAVPTVPWQEFSFYVHPGTAVPGEIFQALLYRELKLVVRGAEASLGYEQVHLPTARVDPGSVNLNDDRDDVSIIPTGESPAAVRYRAALVRTTPGALEGHVLPGRPRCAVLRCCRASAAGGRSCRVPAAAPPAGPGLPLSASC